MPAQRSTRRHRNRHGSGTGTVLGPDRTGPPSDSGGSPVEDRQVVEAADGRTAFRGSRTVNGQRDRHPVDVVWCGCCGKRCSPGPTPDDADQHDEPGTGHHRQVDRRVRTRRLDCGDGSGAGTGGRSASRNDRGERRRRTVHRRRTAVVDRRGWRDDPDLAEPCGRYRGLSRGLGRNVIPALLRRPKSGATAPRDLSAWGGQVLTAVRSPGAASMSATRSRSVSGGGQRPVGPISGRFGTGCRFRLRGRRSDSRHSDLRHSDSRSSRALRVPSASIPRFSPGGRVPGRRECRRRHCRRAADPAARPAPPPPGLRRQPRPAVRCP